MRKMSEEMTKEDLKELIGDVVSNYENLPDVEGDEVLNAIVDKVYTEMQREVKPKVIKVSRDEFEPLLDAFVTKLKKVKLSDGDMEKIAEKFIKGLIERIEGIETQKTGKTLELNVKSQTPTKEDKPFWDEIFETESTEGENFLGIKLEDTEKEPDNEIIEKTVVYVPKKEHSIIGKYI